MLFADAVLARRIESAESTLTTDLAAAVQLRAEPGRVFSARLGGGVAVHVGEPAPFNKLIGIGLAGPLTPDDLSQLAEIERVFAQRDTPVQAEICTLADGSVFHTLCSRGYVLVAFENVLGRALDPAQAGTSILSSPSVSVERLAAPDGSAARAWMDAVVTGFASPDVVPGGASHESFPREAIEQSMRDLVDLEGFVRYIGRVDGAIAGGASLRMHRGVAQLCGSATVPAQRRRGLQSALLARRLLDAATAGCDTAVITTQPGSKSQQNAQRSGFSLLYSRAILLRSAVG